MTSCQVRHPGSQSFHQCILITKGLNWAPFKERRRDIRLAMLFKIVKCNMPVQVEAILLPADPRIRHHHSFKFKHILSHTAQYKHLFLLEQYLSGPTFLKHASTRIPLLHFRRSSVTRPERCACALCTPPPSS